MNEIPEPYDLLEDGEVVVKRVCSNDNMGGNGIDHVVFFSDKYWCLLDDNEPTGPYDSVMDAVLKNEVNRLWNGSEWEITVSLPNAEDFKSVFKSVLGESLSIKFNGEIITIS